MTRRKRVKTRKDSLSVTGEKQKQTSQDIKLQPTEHEMFSFAVTVLTVAICVAPLTAETSGLSRHKSAVLKMDEAFLTVRNELDTDLVVSWVSEHCYQCLYQQLGLVPAAPSPGQPSSRELTVNTQHQLTLQVNTSQNNLELCKVLFHFGEHGNYSLWVKNLNNHSFVNCTVITDGVPVNSYIPLLAAFLVFAGLAIVCAIGRALLCFHVVKGFLFRISGSIMETEMLINSDLGSPGRSAEPVTANILPPPSRLSKRLRSLDTFRGFSLIIMVFVNYGGGRYWFFRHESWNGLTVADLVFPWFVFIMGTSIALSFNSLLCSGSTRCSLLRKAIWRSVQLFIIGVFVINPNYCHGPLSWDSLRIPGVLQRLAWSYLVVASLELLVARTHLDTDAWWSSFRDVLMYWPAWLCVLLFEVFWLYLTFLLPVPGCPVGYLGPGGIGDNGLYTNCTGGAAGLIDRWLLGENHIYQNPSSRVIYATHMPYDPEGVLGSINSILMAFLGLQAGKIILHYRDHHSSIISRFLMWGLMLGILSALLTKCSRDQGFIPVNKNLWSLSYVTTLACFAFVLLVLVYYTVDVKKWWTGAPFYYPGMNSILVYVGHEIFEDYFPFRWHMSNSQSHAEHLTQNLVATSCWVLISFLLYRKKIFWKI
ncbi:heparan-alpha-glucosaminide N-acetyltransferase isoform X2 [Thalassophryne amazonica]|uniref:heparan-alpha-glucosaminide N-acetyltransferase isoform X2 n=1 Tax=Thalassophryne amazonica TaxID=390379 RepID=UPI001470EBF3|nr:heparan-alpha-glucosaminide N-acetyltransferase isoform X2 [Thalassophryne amazonica]